MQNHVSSDLKSLSLNDLKPLVHRPFQYLFDFINEAVSDHPEPQPSESNPLLEEADHEV